MSILKEIHLLLNDIGIPLETGYFSGTPPDEYIVVTPMADTFAVFADNLPQGETQEVRISLFSKNNYLTSKNRLTSLLFEAGFTITDRRYIGFETDTKYHHVAIDVAKEYGLEEE